MVVIRCICTFAVLLILSESYTNSNENVCPILKHPANLTISKILGNWYVVRGIVHTSLRVKNTSPSRNACPSIIVTLGQQEVTFRWNETAKELKLQINYNNPNLFQTTSTVAGGAARTLQITEVDDNYIVLTVCFADKRLGSAILHREPKFKQEEVLIATNKLVEHNLNIDNSFDQCISEPLSNVTLQT